MIKYIYIPNMYNNLNLNLLNFNYILITIQWEKKFKHMIYKWKMF
jgi:hypothetical protein